MSNDPIVITSIARTPMGGMLGVLSSLSANQLGAVAIKAAVERAGLKPEDIEEVIMGHASIAIVVMVVVVLVVTKAKLS